MHVQCLRIFCLTGDDNDDNDDSDDNDDNDDGLQISTSARRTMEAVNKCVTTPRAPTSVTVTKDTSLTPTRSLVSVSFMFSCSPA